MPYSTVDDLLIGDLMVSPKLDKNKFIAQAAEEMDAKLGFVYTLPLQAFPVSDPAPDPNDWTALPIHQNLLLKGINNKLASGRLILTLAVATEGSTLHAYGLRLVSEATTELLMIANMDIILDAKRLNASTTNPDRTPAVVNHDEESAVDMFESVMRPGETSTWQPGSAKPIPYYPILPYYVGNVEE